MIRADGMYFVKPDLHQPGAYGVFRCGGEGKARNEMVGWRWPMAKCIPGVAPPRTFVELIQSMI